MKQSAPRHWYTSNVHERGSDNTRLLKHIIRWGNQPLMKANQAEFIRILYIIIITDIIPLVFVWIKEKTEKTAEIITGKVSLYTSARMLN